MKQQFIIQEGHARLTLFFAGWGMDIHPFLDYRPAESDLLVCYDYRSLDFDYSQLQAYDKIYLVGWSMGVWAASQIFAETRYNLESIAVNGTNYPVDDDRGIPKALFEGTLNGLTDVALRKFYRRMCGSAELLNRFLTRAPQRSVDELKKELFKIGEQSVLQPFSSFKWKKAIVGLQDHIFAPGNQLRAFADSATVITEDVPHYSETLLRQIIEQWIKN